VVVVVVVGSSSSIITSGSNIILVVVERIQALVVEIIVVLIVATCKLFTMPRIAGNPKFSVARLRALQLFKQPDCAQPKILRNRVTCKFRMAIVHVCMFL
jgi:hypothetical protein